MTKGQRIGALVGTLAISAGVWGQPFPACNNPPPGAGDCLTPTPGVPGCLDHTCCETICASDTFCCDTEWDDLCVIAAESQCGLIPPLVLRDCHQGATQSQRLNDSFLVANTSDAEFAFLVADSIDPNQLPLDAFITNIRWWGLSLQFDDEGGGFIGTCTDDDPTSFDIIFFADDGIPGNGQHSQIPFATRTVTPTVVVTGIDFGAGLTAIIEYTATLTPPVANDGSIEWLAIQRHIGASVVDPGTGDIDPCVWLWVDEQSGQFGGEARQDGEVPPELNTDFTWCLTTQPQPPCPWDLNDDGQVNVPDLLLLLGDFRSCDGSPADFDGDGCVGVPDLLALIANFGPCDDAAACLDHDCCDDGDPCTLDLCINHACFHFPLHGPGCDDG